MDTQKLQVVSRTKDWAVVRKGDPSPISVHATQDEAIRAAEQLARAGSVEVTSTVLGPAPRDVVSVGSRVSWSALLSGAVVAMTVYLTLGVLGVAVGVTVRSTVSSSELAVGGAIWSTMAVLVSLFAGGVVVSRCTAGEDKGEAVTYGMLLWGVNLLALILATGAGLQIGVGPLLREASVIGDSRSVAGVESDAPSSAGLTEAQYEELRDEVEDIVGDISPEKAAWWTFGWIVLSMLSAVAGSVVGAGPALVIRQYRERRRLVLRT